MLRTHTGDVTLEWIMVSAIGVLILCAIVYGIMTKARTVSGGANTMIGNLRDPSSSLYNFSATATSTH
jgi:hypothetical protein